MSRSVDSMKVGEIMAREVWTVTPETTVGELVRILSEQQISGVPVITGSGSLRGVVSVTDVLRLAADEPFSSLEESSWEEAWDEFEQDGEAEDGTVPQSYFIENGSGHSFVFRPALDQIPLPFADHTVEDIMTPATFTVNPRESVRELSRFLARGRIHRALVVEDGKLVGIVTAFDVVKALAA
jgi:CBS domain-containing protein